MALIKTHKRKKSTRYHGKGMGTCGTGARKNKRKSGHKGGKGMSGSGKRADHKKTMITKLYGNKYFGKSGITSKSTEKDKRKRMNLWQVENNQEKFKNKNGEIDLSNYKILSEGEISQKLIIKASEASKLAIEKVKVKGGNIILPEKKQDSKKDKVNIDKKEVEIKEKKKVEKKVEGKK